MIKINGIGIGRAIFADRDASRMMFNGIEVWRRGVKEVFLDVQPETIWLTADDNSSAEFVVYSNTDWQIE